jgi:hypothetical protein
MLVGISTRTGRHSDLINGLLYGKSLLGNPVVAERSAKTLERLEDPSGIIG